VASPVVATIPPAAPAASQALPGSKMKNKHFHAAVVDVVVYYICTPLAVLYALLKVVPKCQEFRKKIIKMNRLLLFIILMLNLLRSAMATLDLVALKHMTPALVSQSQDSPYCEASGSLQIFMFDMANLLTVWHM